MSALTVGTDTARGRTADSPDRPPLVLIHGFPHTHRLWDQVVPSLAASRRVVTVDVVAGASAVTLAGRLEELLDDLEIPAATVVGIDAGVYPAVGFALTAPARTAGLAVMEAVLPGVPGAEAYLQSPPWWFGFHQVPDLPETVLVGHEREYVEWFLRSGTVDGNGIGDDLTAAFAAAYTGRDALAGAFAHYRALPETASELATLLERTRLTMPVLAIGAQPVGPLLATQLGPIADDLTIAQVPECGHLIPLDAPHALLDALHPWLGRH